MPALSSPAPTSEPRLLLASRSPRRGQLLRESGFRLEQITPDFQDPADPNQAFEKVPDGPDAALYLAQHKTSQLPDALIAQFPNSTILTSDTVGIAPDGKLIGTPESREQALDMLRSLVGQLHTIATGVCLRLPDGTTESFVDTANVNLGQVSEDELLRYIDTDQWVGKAGGYNLQERQAAGWPITVEGDPGTVMGLPMQRLTPLLTALGIPRHPNPNAAD
ncbi:MAG: Maf family protein [Planctomycetota bacterium]